MRRPDIRALVTPDGRPVPVPGVDGWTLDARRRLVFDLVSAELGEPVAPAQAGIANPGNLHRVLGRPDVLVRVMGATYDPQHRVALHITSEHATAMHANIEQGGYSIQVVVAAIDRPGAVLPTLVLAAVPYEELAAGIARAFARRPGLRRLNVSLSVHATAGGISLGVPEQRVDVPYGLEALARVLRHAPGTAASDMLPTAERVAMVAAVLAGVHGLATTADGRDLDRKFAQRLVRAVGLPEVGAHRLQDVVAPGLRAAVHALERTDLIGAPVTSDLLAAPGQGLTLVEVERKTRNGADKLRWRYVASGQLGCRVRAGILVVRDADLPRFERQVNAAPADVRALTTVEPMSRWYAAYRRLHDDHALARRDRIRRAAA